MQQTRCDSEPARLEDLKSTFIQNVEHELRTPVTILQGYAELLAEGALGALAPEQQQAMFLMVNRAHELRTLVERIGLLLEVEARSGLVTDLTLNEVISKVVEKRRINAAQAELALEVHLEPDLLVSGSLCQLQATFDCLLENAIKFTPRGGRVEVEGYTEPGWVCLAVSDTGIGIEENRLAHLWDGFYQADGSTTRWRNGIGLGLTLARAVIEAHAGRIEAESHPGQGSRFTVKLPIPTPADSVKRAAEDDVTLPRILVVDDEASVVSAFQSGLTKLLKCQVAIATDAEQALQLFEQQPFDVLITDYKMPGMDGMTLATRVRQTYPLTRIIMITAYGGDELREQAARVSIQCILDKPVKLTEVGNAVLEALEQSEGR